MIQQKTWKLVALAAGSYMASFWAWGLAYYLVIL